MGAPRDSTALTLARRRPSIQDMAPGKRSLPGQGRQGPGKRSLPGRPSPYKAIQERSIQDKRSRPRQVELAGKGRSRLRTASQKTRPGRARGPTSFRARRAPCPDKIKTPARHLPGRVALCACAPAHQTTRHPGGYSRDAWRVAVQPGGHGGTPWWRSHRRGKRRRSDRRFWGRRRRALNALVPHYQSRWRPLFAHYSSTITTTTPFTFLPLYLTLTPVGDPLRYKRRPVCNVEGVRKTRFANW